MVSSQVSVRLSPAPAPNFRSKIENPATMRTKIMSLSGIRTTIPLDTLAWTFIFLITLVAACVLVGPVTILKIFYNLAWRNVSGNYL